MSGLEAAEWNHLYESGEFQQHWEYAYPSSELITFVAAGSWPQDAVALDVGCGAGREAIFLASQGFQVTGVDLSEKALEIATERGQKVGVNVAWKLGSALDLPIPDSTVDLVNDRGCFHMITEKDRSQYASELARVLKPGGKVLLRGCRELESEDQRFVLVTPEAVKRYFGAQFECSPVLPVQLVTNTLSQGLKANLVILKRK